MPTIKFNSETYTCAVALKGSNYIHLLDDNGVMIASFDAVYNFDAFTITDGDWTVPAPADSCYVAVIREDGTIAKGSHKCCDIGVCRYNITLPGTGDWKTNGDGTRTYRVTVPNLHSNSDVSIVANSYRRFVYNHIIVSIEGSQLVFTADKLNTYENAVDEKIHLVANVRTMTKSTIA